MKKTLLFLIVLPLLCSNLAFAQSVSWGETIETKNSYFPNIVGEDSSSIYISSLTYIPFEKREYRFERLSKKDYSVLYTAPFEFRTSNNNLFDYSCEREALLNNKYYFFRLIKDKDTGGMLLTPYQFSKDGKKLLYLIR
jgi:hypothetical protein